MNYEREDGKDEWLGSARGDETREGESVRVNRVLLVLDLLVVVLSCGCKPPNSSGDPLIMTANVEATEDSFAPIPLPAYSITLNMEALREIDFSEVNVLLVNRRGEMLPNVNVYPSPKHLAKGEEYSINCFIPLPLEMGDWLDKVNLIVDFTDRDDIATRFVQMPSYTDLNQKKYGMDFDLPPMSGSASFDSEGNVIK